MGQECLQFWTIISIYILIYTIYICLIKMMSISRRDLQQIIFIDLEAPQKYFQSLEEEFSKLKIHSVFSLSSQDSSIDLIQSPTKNQLSDEVQQQTVHFKKKKDVSQKAIPPKARKNRVEVDYDMLHEMNLVFLLLDGKTPPRGEIRKSFKKIAEKMNLSPSTVQRRYRQFRKNRIDVDSIQISQEKLTYMRLKELDRILQEYTKKKPLGTPEQVAQYIKLQFGKQFSNCQIIIGLKKISQKQAIREENIRKEQLLRKKQSEFLSKIYRGFTTNRQEILFFSEYDYYTINLSIVNVALMCGEKGLVFSIRIDNAEKREHPIRHLLDKYYKLYGYLRKYVVVTSTSEIFKKNIIYERRDNKIDFYRAIQSRIESYLPLPLEFEERNLAKFILERNEQEQHTLRERQFGKLIFAQLKNQQKSYTRDLFLSYVEQQQKKDSTDPSLEGEEMERQQLKVKAMEEEKKEKMIEDR